MSLIRGKMPAVWQAKWIDPELEHDKEERQPASVLSRRFTVKSTENAVLYITCHGLYEAVLNGLRVGDFVLAPARATISSASVCRPTTCPHCCARVRTS